MDTEIWSGRATALCALFQGLGFLEAKGEEKEYALTRFVPNSYFREIRISCVVIGMCIWDVLE